MFPKRLYKTDIKLLYKDDTIMIKYSKKDGTYFYYNRVKVLLFEEEIDKATAKRLAPILKRVYERIYSVGCADGFQNRQNTIITDIIKALKKWFFIKD